MTNLFTNQKETDRAIKAAVDQAKKVLKKYECVICGCTPKPDEWSNQVQGVCIDCG